MITIIIKTCHQHVPVHLSIILQATTMTNNLDFLNFL